jgi:hypothetical protein
VLLLLLLLLLLAQAMDIVHPWTLDGSGQPLLPITTFSIAMIHRQSGGKLPLFIEVRYSAVLNLISQAFNIYTTYTSCVLCCWCCQRL